MNDFTENPWLEWFLEFLAQGLFLVFQWAFSNYSCS